jgi:MSHA biogenesis protein MshQ
LTDNTSKGVITVGGNATVPVVAFSAGSAVLNNSDANHPLATYAFNINPTAPSTIGIVATDTDSGPGTPSAGSAYIRSGRLRTQNMYGSELLPLTVPLEAQYWTGSLFTTNTLDSCTAIPMTSIMMGPYIGTLAACNTQLTPAGSQTMVAGKLPSGPTLTKPGVAGSVTLALNVSATAIGNTCVASTPSSATAAAIPWFGANPQALATFGIYKSPLIYRRENY